MSFEESLSKVPAGFKLALAAYVRAAAKRMFEAYNEQGPNPWKTFDGRDVPRWEQLGEQVQAKWIAAAEVAHAPRAQDQVRQFQAKFDQILGDRPRYLTVRKLRERIEFLQEELDEFKNGVMNDDLPEQADALVDLVYVAIGTANMMGLPWDELWNDVQRANMAKVKGQKMRGGKMHLVDAVKPPGWLPPMTESILAAHGWDPKDRQRHDDPNRCLQCGCEYAGGSGGRCEDCGGVP